jgi:ATP-binding cassette subfamily B protein
MGFRSLGVQVDFETLAVEVPFPCIVHWNKNHFVVVYKIDKTESGIYLIPVMD